MPGMM